MKQFSTSPVSFAQSVVSNWELIRRLTTREFQQRFRGSYLGIVWSVLTPLLTALMFTFVFSAVFAARWGKLSVGPFDFAIMFMLGMSVHGIFAEMMSRAPTMMLNNASYVTKVVFPLEILPVVSMVSALTNAAISTAIVMALQFWLNGQIHATALFLPLVLVPFLALSLGLALIFAAIGVYLRDLGQFMGLLVTATLFLSPVFYPIEAVPEPYRMWMWFNPLTFIIEQARAVTLFGQWPDFQSLVIYTAGSFAVLWVGIWLFQRLRVGFADVL